MAEAIPEYMGLYEPIERRARERETELRRAALERGARRGLEVSGVVGAELGEISGEQQTALMEAQRQLALSEAMARREERLTGEQRAWQTGTLMPLQQQQQKEMMAYQQQLALEQMRQQAALQEQYAPGWLESLAGGIAPGLGYALGGPLYGLAAGGVSKLFGGGAPSPLKK